MSYTSTYSGDFVDPTLRSYDRYLYNRYIGPLPKPYYSTYTTRPEVFQPASWSKPNFHSPPPVQPQPVRLPPIDHQNNEGIDSLKTDRDAELYADTYPPPHSYLHMRGVGHPPPPRKVVTERIPTPKTQPENRQNPNEMPNTEQERYREGDEIKEVSDGMINEKENNDHLIEDGSAKMAVNAQQPISRRERSFNVITNGPSYYALNSPDYVKSNKILNKKLQLIDHLNTTNRIFHIEDPDNDKGNAPIVGRLDSPPKGKRNSASGRPPLPVVNRRPFQPKLIKSEQLDSPYKLATIRNFSRQSNRQAQVEMAEPQNDVKVGRLKSPRRTRSYPSTPIRYIEKEKNVRTQNEDFYTNRQGGMSREIPRVSATSRDGREAAVPVRERKANYAKEFREERMSDYAVQDDLKIIVLDLLGIENSFDHHTVKYDAVRNGNLVVRRGQTFDILIKFNREFNFKSDSLNFVFETGPDPLSVNGTYVQCLLGSKDNSLGWRVMIKKRIARDEMMVFVYTSPDTIVSRWKMTIETVELLEDRIKAVSLSKEIHMYILFNPWCQDDSTYFPDNRLLEEYVNNDSGVIFQGNYKQIGGKPWFFGQFEDGILDAAIYCMQKGFNFKFDFSMGDPVRVSRAISKIVNSHDDTGILVGNWSNNYTQGVSPLKWSGSVAILKEYMETEKPVKFGQCFVFSGIATTICRAIGLPCRSVTNYASAHDTDGSTTIDIYWDLEKGERISHGETRDSVWNFHVWNDVWMQRRDLPPQFSGWQAIDSTPQERSKGKMQCGPASLHAIKEGLTEHAFDGPFVFAEVNGDKINWTRNIDGRRYVLSVDSSAIGKNISTKVPDGKPIPANLTNVERIRQDITHQYKYEEESDRERIATTTAQRLAHGRKPYYNTGRQDVEFEGFEKLDYIMIGSDFDVGGLLKNNSNEMRSVEAKFICESVSYKGHRLVTIKQQTFSGMLKPRSSNRAAMLVNYNEYAHRLNEQASMKVSMIIRVLETGQKHAWQDDFRLRRPDLNVDLKENTGRVLQPMECKVSFTNPLPDTRLTNCTITIEGAGFMEAQQHMPVVDIPPKDRWSAALTLTPTKPGKRQIFITFNSDIIQDISGVADINIE